MTIIIKIIPFNQEDIVVAIGIIINPILLKKITLIKMLTATDKTDILNGVLVSFLANKKLENIRQARQWLHSVCPGQWRFCVCVSLLCAQGRVETFSHKVLNPICSSLRFAFSNCPMVLNGPTCTRKICP